MCHDECCYFCEKLAPKPPKKWSGILNATRDTPLCLQNLGGNVRGSEDCLYLNVYRPKNDRENMPVLFRVHGGAFQVGNIGPRENADYLMDEDLVLVQIHYRMNAIGFASLGNKLMPGNYGIKDQVMALKWVQQNIASFGGNPKSVTVYGESAGAASVHILLKAPATEGMVHRAIADSGTVNHIWSQVKTDIVKNGTLQLAAKIGCPISGDDLEIFNCLQGVSSETLVSALPEGMAGVDSYVPCFEPKDAEDAVMTEDLSMLPSNKPFITSNCNGEFLIPYSSLNPQVITYAHENLDSYLEEYITKYLDVPDPSRSREGAAILKKSYFPTMEPLQNFTLELANVGGDITFIYPALYNLVYHQGPKWYYYLTYIGELSKAASRAWVRIGNIPDVAAHADQRLYYFNYRSEYGFGPKDTPEDYQVSKRMIKYLVNFAYYEDQPKSKRHADIVTVQKEATKPKYISTLYPNHDTIKSADDTKAYIQKKLKDPLQHGIKIQNVRRVQDRGVLVEVDSAYSLAKIKDVLGRYTKVQLKEPQKRYPKLMAYGVRAGTTIDQLKSAISHLTDDQAVIDATTIAFSHKQKNSNVENMCFSVHLD
ncbi:hypothetical protein GE061_018679 [Apolygus lucorum]|uniref:Carboxylic ester hydrolase n=1 Tax=Apolygus lucorum TaxID=248454 RepID=A0A8S9XHA3_APOLU|nr:hypothetical protein GE061_018679 [Apolygus lucorum]